MSDVVFLATVKGPGATVYGKDHVVSLSAAADETQIRQWQNEGKVALTGVTARNVRVAAVAATTAQLAWTVDQPAVGMAVYYGVSPAANLTQNATPVSGTGDVVANLTGLTTATTYAYIVNVANAAGALTRTPTATFTTL